MITDFLEEGEGYPLLMILFPTIQKAFLFFFWPKTPLGLSIYMIGVQKEILVLGALAQTSCIAPLISLYVYTSSYRRSRKRHESHGAYEDRNQILFFFLIILLTHVSSPYYLSIQSSICN